MSKFKTKIKNILLKFAYNLFQKPIKMGKFSNHFLINSCLPKIKAASIPSMKEKLVIKQYPIRIYQTFPNFRLTKLIRKNTQQERISFLNFSAKSTSQRFSLINRILIGRMTDKKIGLYWKIYGNPWHLLLKIVTDIKMSLKYLINFIDFSFLYFP